MSPLERILSWWQPLGEWSREIIAADICLRVLDGNDCLHRSNDLFSEYLSENLGSVIRHTTRALTVRGLIDFIIAKIDLENSLRWHLDAVEVDDPFLKKIANGAIGRHQKVAPEWDTTVRSWSTLRATELSDREILSWERRTLCLR